MTNNIILLSQVGNIALQFPDGRHMTKSAPDSALPFEHEKWTSVFILVSFVLMMSPFFEGIVGQWIAVTRANNTFWIYLLFLITIPILNEHFLFTFHDYLDRMSMPSRCNAREEARIVLASVVYTESVLQSCITVWILGPAFWIFPADERSWSKTVFELRCIWLLRIPTCRCD